MITINDVELEFDVMDADTAHRYEDALNAALEKKSVDVETLAESIRVQCTAVFEFFNEVFGPGTDRKVFGEKTNLTACLDAFDIVVESASAQFDQVQRRISGYSPNRAARKAR